MRERLYGPLLFVAVVAVFGQTVSHGTVLIDDHLYLAEQVTRGFTLEGIRWSFTTLQGGNWHPLTWLSLMLDGQLWGSWIGGYHLTALLLHACNAVLLYWLLRRLTLAPARSALAAGLFALHPLRAESVAWLAERKDVLSGLFFLLTLIAWLRQLERPTAGRRAAVIAALAAGLLCKPMLVTTPLVLLLLDHWPLRRSAERPWTALWAEKAPLFALCFAHGLVTIVAQRAAGAMASIDSLPLANRLATAGLAIPRYLAMTLWPVGLSPHYLPDPQPRLALAAAAGAVTLCASAAIFLLRRRLPPLYLGWFWFLGMLLPVLGLVQVGTQALADRYTYLPHIGLFIALVWSLPVPASPIARRVAAAAATLSLAALSARCAVQVQSWRDTATLLASSAASDPEGLTGLLARAVEAEKQGKLDEALALFARAGQRGQDMAAVHYGAGVILLEQGQPARAAAELVQAVRLEPSSALFRRLWARALAGSGRLDAAAKVLRDLLAREKGDVDARAELGLLLGRLGADQEAALELLQASRQRPGDARLHFNLGVALARARRFEEAVRAFEAALSITPDLPGARALLEDARKDASSRRGAPAR